MNESAKFLYESGLLGEINRRVMHPRGFALSVVEDEKGNIFFGAIQKGDETGMHFTQEALDLTKRKLDKFDEENNTEEILRKRMDVLGFTVQPL